MTRTLSDPEAGVAPANTSRARIVWAASQLVHADSYHSVGVTAICNLAGVQRGSFYHYFESKEALMLDVLDMQWEQFEREALALCRDHALTPRGRIDAHVDYIHARRQREKRETGRVLGCVFGNFGAESSATDDAIRRRVLKVFADWARALQDPLVDAQACGEVDDQLAPDLLATQTVAALEGLSLLAKVHNDPDIVLIGGRFLTERLWGGGHE